MELSIDLVESGAAVWAGLGDAPRAARLLGAGETQRTKVGIPRGAPDQRHLDRFLRPVHKSSARSDWDHEYWQGQSLTLEGPQSLRRSPTEGPRLPGSLGHDRSLRKSARQWALTGSVAGLGRETAQALIAQGHEVIIHARSQDRLAAVNDLIDRGALRLASDLSPIPLCADLRHVMNGGHGRQFAPVR